MSANPEKVCFMDGWHYSVVEDNDAREYALAVATARFKFEMSRGDDAGITAAQDQLDEVTNQVFEKPDQRLVLEDDGTYRPATDADTDSWNDRKHQRFVSVEMS